MTEAAPGAQGMPTGGPGGETPAGGSPMSERMQALLSRAVEDQLSEQRQLTNALADIRALLVRLPEDVRAAAATAIGEQGDDVRADVDGIARELRAGLQALGERLDATARAGGSDAADRLDARLAAVEAALTRQTERLEQLAAQDHDELLSRLDALSDRLIAIDERSSASPDVAGQVRSAVDDLGRTLMAGQVSATDLESAVRLVVPEIVTNAHANTERRLAAHVDEAVLALAEALLRRRQVRPAYPADTSTGGFDYAEPGSAEPAAPVMAPDAGAAAGSGSLGYEEPGVHEVLEAPDGPGAGEEADGSIVERLDLDADEEMEELAETPQEEPPVAHQEQEAGEPEPGGSAGGPAAPGSQPPLRPATYPRPTDEPRRRPWWRPGD